MKPEQKVCKSSKIHLFVLLAVASRWKTKITYYNGSIVFSVMVVYIDNIHGLFEKHMYLIRSYDGTYGCAYWSIYIHWSFFHPLLQLMTTS